MVLQLCNVQYIKISRVLLLFLFPIFFFTMLTVVFCFMYRMCDMFRIFSYFKFKFFFKLEQPSIHCSFYSYIHLEEGKRFSSILNLCIHGKKAEKTILPFLHTRKNLYGPVRQLFNHNQIIFHFHYFVYFFSVFLLFIAIYSVY